jgi:site-specific recombinase XerD
MLAESSKRYLEDLVRAGASVHTVDAYAADLREFLESLAPKGAPDRKSVV